MKLPRRRCPVCVLYFKPISDNHFICSYPCAIKKKTEQQAAKIEKIKGKIWKKEKVEKRIDTHAKEHRKALQVEINKLARMIDAKFGYGCIDCCGRPYGKQIDGAHFFSVGSNSSLRYNLHNIHSADSQCNNFSNTHLSGYVKGIELRYGLGYLKMLQSLPVNYKELKLSNVEIHEKLKLVRSLIRGFNTFQFPNGYWAREHYNKLIGIYT